MLDYHGDCVALSEFATALGAASFPDPALSDAQQRAVEAVDEEPGAALLGAFVQQLFVHAASDGAELELLGRASELWGRGRGLCDRLGAVRADLEAAMEDPGAPGADDRFNDAAVAGQEIANEATLMRTEFDAVRADALAFHHLPPHPRQADLGTDTWDWGNLPLARRTDAFVRALFDKSVDRPTLGFAVGAAAAYGANVAGSAYLNHVVGGPRRSHRHRDRLARNTVGSWLAQHHPAAQSPGAMAARVRLGGDGLPSEVEAQISGALAAVFDLARTTTPPDLQLGHRRLLEHLALLDGFAMPAEPVQPGQVWMERLWGDPANPPPSLRPQDVDLIGQDGGGVGARMGPGEPGSGRTGDSDSSKTAKGCAIGVLIIILIDLLQAFIQCIGQWADGNSCTFWRNMLLSKLWEQEPPDPRVPTNPGVSRDKLTGIAGAPQAVELVGLLHETHQQAWEAMERARNFLAMTGLIYPSSFAGLPLYEQFTGIPSEEVSPHREELDPVSTYHRYPESAIEERAEQASPFLVDAPPDVFYDPGARLHAATVTLGLWGQIATGEHDTQNLDLDADRGFGHPCWAANGSVQDQPVDVVILGYDDH